MYIAKFEMYVAKPAIYIAKPATENGTKEKFISIVLKENVL